MSSDGNLFSERNVFVVLKVKIDKKETTKNI